jgi:hypothetical protein
MRRPELKLGAGTYAHGLPMTIRRHGSIGRSAALAVCAAMGACTAKQEGAPLVEKIGELFRCGLNGRGDCFVGKELVGTSHGDATGRVRRYQERRLLMRTRRVRRLLRRSVIWETVWVFGH